MKRSSKKAFIAHILTLAAVIAVSLSIFASPAGAENDSQYNFYENPSTGLSIYAAEGADLSGDITLPSTYNNGQSDIDYPINNIKEAGFKDCTKITGVTIPDGYIRIFNNAFEGCTSLRTVEIPASVTYFYGDAFDIFNDCSALTSINVDPNNAFYSSINGVLYNKNKTYLYKVPEGITGSFTIPDTVTGIAPYAFNDCTGITSIEIPSSVTSIGNDAFSGCTGLTDVYYESFKEDWDCINIAENNTSLLNATLNFRDIESACLHSVSRKLVDPKYLKSEANCISSAFYYESCVACGKAFDNENNYDEYKIFPVGEIAEDNHVLPDVMVQGPSTHYYMCTLCLRNIGEGSHEYKNYTSNGSLMHSSTCICGAVDMQYCSGGVATCTQKAICEVCNGFYGNLDSTNHDYDLSEWGYKDAYGHAHMCKREGCNTYDPKVMHTSSGAATETTPEICTVCGYVINPATGHTDHTPIAEWSMNTTNHWKECIGCTEQKLEMGVHVYDNAEDTICNTCGYVRDTTHSYTYTSDGTQHWLECSDCGDEKPGSRGVHMGGVANCTEKATCGICNLSYGNSDPNNHDFRADMILGPDTHYYVCNRCNARRDEAEHEYQYTSYGGTHLGFCACGAATNLQNCSGGIANCAEKAICEVCNGPYGDLDTNDHDYSSEMIQGPDTHYYVCSRCNARRDEEEHEYQYTSYGGTHLGICACGKATELQNCSGGIATCTEKAVCEFCNRLYGDLDPTNHDYDLSEWGYKSDDGHAHMCRMDCNAHDTVVLHTSSGAATEDSAEYCTVCGYEINPSTGHIEHTPAEDWSMDVSRHWKACIGCSKRTFDIGAHDFDNPCDTTCNTCGYVRKTEHRYIKETDDIYHWEECILCDAEKPNTREAHSGGMATCNDRAMCDICHNRYGDIDESNHDYSSDLMLDPHSHYYECGRCHIRKNEEAHEYKNYTSNGGRHIGTCVCGAEDMQSCIGGVATCTDQAMCEVCHALYGNIEPNNHDYSLDLIQGVMTHYYECRRCHAKKDEAGHGYGNYHSTGNDTHSKICICGKGDTQPCSGGTATCIEEAVCEVCNSHYGNIDPSNHDYRSRLVQDEDTHYYECRRCHDRKDEEKHAYSDYVPSNNADMHKGTCICGKKDEQSCFGGAATCTDQAICSICHASYGKLAPDNHDYSIDIIQGETTHYYECNRCFVKRDEVLHIFEHHTPCGDNMHSCACTCGKALTASCSGGTATCLEKAVCEYCNTEYGDLAAHNYDITSWGYQNGDAHAHACTTPGCDMTDTLILHTSSGDATEYEPEVCTVCGYVINPILPHSTHIPGAEWSFDDEYHWHECKKCQEQQLEKEEHSYESNGMCICGAEVKEEESTTTDGDNTDPPDIPGVDDDQTDDTDSFDTPGANKAPTLPGVNNESDGTTDAEDESNDTANNSGCSNTLIGTPLALMIVSIFVSAVVFKKNRIK